MTLKELLKLNRSDEEGVLDLSARDLTALPPQIGELTDLTDLNLARNQLTAVPPEIGKLTNLMVLGIRGNKLTALPPQIGKLTNLTKLYLHENSLTALPPEIGNLTNLRVLNLWDNKLTSLPPQIGKLTDLTELNLSKNQLTPLPPRIGKLTKLMRLDVRANQLTALPPEIGNLPNLTDLNLARNQLTALPPQIGMLTDLTGLYVSANQLTSLPPQIGELTNLRKLHLWSNQLTALPPQIGKLTKLGELDLRNNKLTSLPPQIGKLTCLTHLDFSENQLTVLPTQIGELTNLTRLYVSANQLTALPPQIGKLKKLTELYLPENQLTALPPQIGKLTKLRLLHLGGNKLTALPPVIGELTNLTELNLSQNQLTALPHQIAKLTKLTKLNVSNNKLTALPPQFGKLTYLTKLALQHNQLTALSPQIDKITNLTVLGIAGNNLTALPPVIGKLTNLTEFDAWGNQLTAVPPQIDELTKLTVLNLGGNKLTALPAQIGELTNLTRLILGGNKLTALPPQIGKLTNLTELYLFQNQLTALPPQIGKLTKLRELHLGKNNLTALPPQIGKLTNLTDLDVSGNPLNPDLAAAYEEGIDVVKRYLRAKAEAQVVLNEAKLILIGEGEVGKSCLLGALRGDPWEEGRPATHGIEIKPVKVTDPDSGREITLNGWDFGGQRVCRPTHQLFFSAPAVYLVVWKPREGSQAGAVKEWINLVKHREPDAKVLVVATHGGPKERLPDIDRQEIWDLFGKDTVVDFYHVDSRPANYDNETGEWTGERAGIRELTDAIARVGAELTDYTVPAKWKEAREALKETGGPYLSWDKVVGLVHEHEIDKETVPVFVRWCHRLGHLIHYGHDPALREIVILKPDWLATAVSFVLDDGETRENHGLVSFDRLSRLWHDPGKPEDSRYPAELHPAFLRLMERFDLSYRVAEPHKVQSDGTSLIAQLVSDVRPVDDLARVWPEEPETGDGQQIQICQIVDAANGQSAIAEGLFYQLIVRLHRYSLGRVNHHDSVHWQRGLVLDDDYNGRALLEHVGNDVRITVRAPYPERFLSVLTEEVKWLVESFWEGLRCDVMVPCIKPCGRDVPGTALFDVEKLIASKKRERLEYPCPVCDEWQDIDALLRNAPAARRLSAEELLAQLAAMKGDLAGVREQLIALRGEAIGRFDRLDVGTQCILSKVDDAFTSLMQSLTDEARHGPRLFSLTPVEPGFWHKPDWVTQKVRVTLWCEHSRVPLPVLWNDESRGVYTFEQPRKWLVKVAPYARLVGGALSLVLPVAGSAVKWALGEGAYKRIEADLDLSQKAFSSLLGAAGAADKWMPHDDEAALSDVSDQAERVQTSRDHLDRYGEPLPAQGALLRELRALVKDQDPDFGGLKRVQNRRHEYLWIHPSFEKEFYPDPPVIPAPE